MDTWLITRYLLARFQQLSALSSGFRKAKPVVALLRWGAIVRDNLREVGLCLAKRWRGCVRTLHGMRLISGLKVSMRVKMGILRQVVWLGMRGAGTRVDHG